MNTTENGFLDNRLYLLQPTRGYRAGSDAVLLAAAVPALTGETVLDVGCGVGTISLCLAQRVMDLSIAGLEIQEDMVALARQNTSRNNLDSQVTVWQGDLVALPTGLAGELFDHVVTNPPYYKAGEARPSPDETKAQAHMEGATTLRQWVEHCVALVKPGGTMTLIHRMDRLGDIVLGLGGQGETVLFPLWPRAGAPARQVIVQVTRGEEPAIHLTAGMVLHEPDGAFTQGADDVLRGRSALALGAEGQ